MGIDARERHELTCELRGFLRPKGSHRIDPLAKRARDIAPYQLVATRAICVSTLAS